MAKIKPIVNTMAVKQLRNVKLFLDIDGRVWHLPVYA